MLSIIVLSSDGYSDCWDPFFYLLKKNFPEALNHEIILSCNDKDYSYDGIQIKTLKHGLHMPWSNRLILSLEEAQSDIVLVIVEDFFILSKINVKVFNELLNSILTNDKIDHIRLLYKPGKIKTKNSIYKNLDEITHNSKHRFLYLPGLWKKQILKKYLVSYETPYMAEKIGDYRSWILKDNFYAISSEYVKKNGNLYGCATSGAIIKGKWGKWLPERLQENGLDLDLSLRGFKDAESNRAAKINIYLYLFRNAKTTIRSLLSLIGLIFRQDKK